ncbi:MAG: DNA primase small subunit domain-containing protein [archaeon]
MFPETFVKTKFKEFYSNNKTLVPFKLDEREFGVGAFGKKIVSRHLAFQSENDFNYFLSNSAPLFISHSLAYYSFPSRTPMKDKGFKGADLAFEFDVDDLQTDCKKEHDSWKCGKCGATGKGLIKNCPNCGFGVLTDEWFCSKCLEIVKQQTFRLIDFLTSDFGFSIKDLSINYSGAKGLHVWLSGNTIKDFSHSARIELIDYLTANNLDLQQQGFVLTKQVSSVPKLSDSKGWSKKILSELKNYLFKVNYIELAAITGVSVKTTKRLLENRDFLLTSIDRGVLIDVSVTRNLDFWNNLFDFIVSKTKIEIDRQTSTDIRKILRVPETLHGGTGLKAAVVKDLNAFNALTDTIVFSEQPVKLKLKKTPRFELNENFYGPFKENEIVSLPENVAVFLSARGNAVDVNL